MKIELGKTYRTRDGEVVKITADLRVGAASDLFYPFQGSNGETYTAKGTVWTSLPSEIDLVEEVLLTDPSPVIPTTNDDLNEDAAADAEAAPMPQVFDDEDVNAVWRTYEALLLQTLGSINEPNIDSLVAARKKLLREIT